MPDLDRQFRDEPIWVPRSQQQQAIRALQRLNLYLDGRNRAYEKGWKRGHQIGLEAGRKESEPVKGVRTGETILAMGIGAACASVPGYTLTSALSLVGLGAAWIAVALWRSRRDGR